MLIDPICINRLHRNGIRNTSPTIPLPELDKNATETTCPLPVSFVTTGLIDLQINGFAGVDYNNPLSAPEHIVSSLKAMLATGVTRCLPTIITADLAWQSACFEALEAARNSSPLAKAMIAGYLT